jgi:hypothetical protein
MFCEHDMNERPLGSWRYCTPAAATPMTVDTPQPRWLASSADRTTSTEPVCTDTRVGRRFQVHNGCSSASRATHRIECVVDPPMRKTCKHLCRQRAEGSGTPPRSTPSKTQLTCWIGVSGVSFGLITSVAPSCNREAQRVIDQTRTWVKRPLKGTCLATGNFSGLLSTAKVRLAPAVRAACTTANPRPPGRRPPQSRKAKSCSSSRQRPPGGDAASEKTHLQVNREPLANDTPCFRSSHRSLEPHLTQGGCLTDLRNADFRNDSVFTECAT